MNCKNKSYFFEDLDSIIIAEIKKLSLDCSLIDKLQENSKATDTVSNNQIIEDRIKEIDIQVNRLLDLYQLGTLKFENIAERINALNKEKDSLIDDLEDENETNSTKINKEQAIDLLKKENIILDGNDMEEKRALVHALIDKIVLLDEDVTIHWSFV